MSKLGLSSVYKSSSLRCFLALSDHVLAFAFYVLALCLFDRENQCVLVSLLPVSQIRLKYQTQVNLWLFSEGMKNSRYCLLLHCYSNVRPRPHAHTLRHTLILAKTNTPTLPALGFDAQTRRIVNSY